MKADIFRLVACDLSISGFLGICSRSSPQLNILWIPSEDDGRHPDRYGDPIARTPNLDALAAKGIRYTHCNGDAHVCAPARSNWILDTHAPSLETHHMRSKYRMPRVRFLTYPELINQSGYYTPNSSKTDDNTHSIDVDAIWDECSPDAHFIQRPKGSPFLAVFNFTDSHESRVFTERWQSRDPHGLKLPDQTEAIQDTPEASIRKGRYSTRIVNSLKAGGSSSHIPKRAPHL